MRTSIFVIGKLMSIAFIVANPALGQPSSIGGKSARGTNAQSKSKSLSLQYGNRFSRKYDGQYASMHVASRARSTETYAPRASEVAPVEVGILGGLNMGYGASSPTRSGSTRNALSLSIFADIPVYDGFSLAPEISLVQRGVQTDLYSFSTGTISGMISLDTLELPLLARYRWEVTHGFALIPTLGPYGSILMSRSVQVASVLEMDLSTRFKGFDAGLMFGIGAAFGISRNMTILSMTRYTMGLLNLDSTGNAFYTRGIQTLLGFQMRF